MSKFKKIYLPLLVSVTMNTVNVHASAAAAAARDVSLEDIHAAFSLSVPA